MIPPTPHPNPYKELKLAVTVDGLLIKSASHSVSSPWARVSWGKTSSISAIDPSSSTIDWHAATIFGIIGILRLYHGSYLMVISSRLEIGARECVIEDSMKSGNRYLESTVLDRPLYAVKGVVAIPLEQTAAMTALNGIEARGHLPPSSSNPSRPVMDVTGYPSDVASDDGYSSSINESEHKPWKLTSSSSTPVDTLLPRLETPHLPLSTSPQTVGKTITDRLSFWKSKNRSEPIPNDISSTDLPNDPVGDPNAQSSEDLEVLNAMVQAAEGVSLSTSSSQRGEPSPMNVTLSNEEKITQLELKIMKECTRLFSREMYFAYDFDITTPLQRKFQKTMDVNRRGQLLQDLANAPASSPLQVLSEPHSNIPLWRRVDRRFWWNEDLSSGFVEAGLHDYVLPVMQGYVQISAFTSPVGDSTMSTTSPQLDVDEEAEAEDVDYIIISRRSRQRAGLRYQRRGIDEDANVANFVETETVLKINRADVLNVFSHVQIRGSIPLFWSQPGMNLKPSPKLDRTLSESSDALRRHFAKTIKIYGPHTVVNLAEVRGKEAVVTNAYKEVMADLKIKDTSYREFDFHTECKGMKYENISKLLNDLERTFLSQGFFWVAGSEVLSKQRGVFRVNCIDCLDRTNVVESAFARHVLEQQLQALALIATSSERREIDIIFNDVWANNGDAVSRSYAGTSALKGDYTRTGKRDLSGMLNDGMNSLARMYTATFSDYFSQAVIDYALGHRSLSVFSEFMQNMTSTDPRELFRLSKIRAIAIETCSALVVLEGEEIKAGWTLFSPLRMNTKVGTVFEEKVLLITSKALYVVSYDYSLEKVKMYTRVPLGNIVEIQKGAYVLSPLQEAGRDPSQNYGFIVSYRPLDQVETRVTSYSMKNSPTVELDDPLSQTITLPSTSSPTTTSFRSSHAAAPPHHQRTNSKTSTSSQKNRKSQRRSLSNLLSNVEPTGSGEDIVYVAFKSLPIDYTKERQGSEALGTGAIPSGFLRRAMTCQENVDEICALITASCADVGLDGTSLMVEKDVVSLLEAQKSTPVFAKAEYAIKRLLWLGS